MFACLYFLAFLILFYLLSLPVVRSRVENPYVVLFYISCLLHVLAIFSNIGLPVSLLYGPCLYLAYKKQYKFLWPRQQTAFHLAPFFTLSLIYIGLYTGVEASVFTEQHLEAYHRLHFLAMPVSLLSYGIVVFNRKHGSNHRFEQLTDRLCMLSLFAGILLGVLALSKFLSIPELGFSPQWIVIVLLATAAVLFSFYLWPLIRKSLNPGAVKPAGQKGRSVSEQALYAKSLVDTALLAEYEVRLKDYFDSTKAYLEPGISAEKVASDLGISKHHFSQLLNVYIGKSFYRYIAYHRIMHALDLIGLSQTPLSIEALASECGFNSKTSFNRYFREFTGYTPSEFKHILYTQISGGSS